MLRGIDLALPAGALVRVEGANGTGKSTLLRLLAGIDAPSEGRITGHRPRTSPSGFRPPCPSRRPGISSTSAASTVCDGARRRTARTTG